MKNNRRDATLYYNLHSFYFYKTHSCKRKTVFFFNEKFGYLGSFSLCLCSPISPSFIIHASSSSPILPPFSFLPPFLSSFNYLMSKHFEDNPYLYVESDGFTLCPFPGNRPPPLFVILVRISIIVSPHYSLPLNLSSIYSLLLPIIYTSSYLNSSSTLIHIFLIIYSLNTNLS